MAPVHHAWIWFPKFPGLTSGIIIGGFGFGALIFNSLSTALINPDNLPFNKETFRYPEEVDENFTKMMQTLILLWAICVLLGAIMVFKGKAPEPRNEVKFDEPEAGQKYKVDESEGEAAE